MASKTTTKPRKRKGVHTEKRARHYREGTAQIHIEVEAADRQILKMEAARLGISMQALEQTIIHEAVKRMKR